MNPITETITPESKWLLSNDAKINACNFFASMTEHQRSCRQCREYLITGDGDLCDDGKQIIAEELCFADTQPNLVKSA